MKFSLIILAYNEEPTIKNVIEKYISKFNNVITVNGVNPLQIQEEVLLKDEEDLF